LDFLENMNRALDYIEAHLTSEIDYQELAAAALCSASNFQRFFTYATGVSLAEYIRRRRLSAAAFELQHSDIKIVDLALKYGYESSASFSRAFQALHKATPTEARKGSKPLKSFPRMFFRFSVKGVTALDYKILEKPAFRMIGIKERISREEDQNLKYMPAFWRAHATERRILSALSDEEPSSVYGVTINHGQTSFDYCVAAISDRPVSELPGSVEFWIPAARWAIFRCVGPLPDSQYEVWRKIF
jgi:AraC family transcriptional regulator